MTLELAESGKHFITTVINGSDLVPTFSTASIDDLRSEVLYLSLLTGSGFIENSLLKFLIFKSVVHYKLWESFNCYFQVTASSWLNDLRDQIERTRVINVVYRSATALGSHLPSIASAKARVAGAGALLRPVSSSTQVKFISVVG